MRPQTYAYSVMARQTRHVHWWYGFMLQESKHFHQSTKGKWPHVCWLAPQQLITSLRTVRYCTELADWLQACPATELICFVVVVAGKFRDLHQPRCLP
jgi:hypothetical protein